jgi:hypothetical protein
LLGRREKRISGRERGRDEEGNNEGEMGFFRK